MLGGGRACGWVLACSAVVAALHAASGAMSHATVAAAGGGAAAAEGLSLASRVRLNDGNRIPVIGLGVYKVPSAAPPPSSHARVAWRVAADASASLPPLHRRLRGARRRGPPCWRRCGAGTGTSTRVRRRAPPRASARAIVCEGCAACCLPCSRNLRERGGCRGRNPRVRHVRARAPGRCVRDAATRRRARAGIPREEIWVTTKLWNADHGCVRVRRQHARPSVTHVMRGGSYDSAIAACHKSLRTLGLAYVDLYLIHVRFHAVDFLI